MSALSWLWSGWILTYGTSLVHRSGFTGETAYHPLYLILVELRQNMSRNYLARSLRLSPGFLFCTYCFAQRWVPSEERPKRDHLLGLGAQLRGHWSFLKGLFLGLLPPQQFVTSRGRAGGPVGGLFDISQATWWLSTGAPCIPR